MNVLGRKQNTPHSWLGVILGVSLLATLPGCAPFNYVQSDSPVAELRLEPLATRPKIALVLGSGGPRGYAHIGALRVLESAGIESDLVVGSSVGALVGAFWSDGWTAEQISIVSQSGGPLTLFDPNPFADRGWIRGQRLQDYVHAQLGDASIEQMPRQLVIVATRRADKAPVFFRRGNLGVAVRASSAMPDIISPVGIDGVEYEDADASLPVAVRAARQAGADFVIAIDVSAWRGAAPADASASMVERDLKRRERIDPEIEQADFLIHPDLAYDAGPRRAYFREAEVCGEATAQALLPALLERIEDWRAGSRGPRNRPQPLDALPGCRSSGQG